MATTKELLEKAMLKIGSHAGTASGLESDKITLTPDGNPPSYYQYFVAPCDGYLSIVGKNPTAVAKVRVIEEALELGQTTFVPVSSGAFSISQFCQKGRRLAYLWGYKMEQISVKFIKSIGGGLKALAETLGRGGELWLRLRVYFKRLSTHESDRLCQKREASPFLTHLFRAQKCGTVSAITTKRTHRRAMGGFAFTQSIARFGQFSKAVASLNLIRLRKMITLKAESASLSEKAYLSTSFLSTRIQSLGCKCLSIPACRVDLVLQGGI